MRNCLPACGPTSSSRRNCCEVCAIASGSVFETAAKVLDYQPEILTIRPSGVDDILQNVCNIASAAGVPEKGREVRESLEARIKRVTGGVPSDGKRPRVVCLDWLDPLRNTGQWAPGDCQKLAGGEEGLATPRGNSREISWDEVRDYAPEYLMIMPCAFGPERSLQEARDKLTVLPGWDDLPAGARRTCLRLRRAEFPAATARGLWTCWRDWPRCCTRSGSAGWRRRAFSTQSLFVSRKGLTTGDRENTDILH